MSGGEIERFDPGRLTDKELALALGERYVDLSAEDMQAYVDDLTAQSRAEQDAKRKPKAAG